MCERCGNISIGNEWICSDLRASEIMQKIHLMHLLPANYKSISALFCQMMKAITGTEWVGKIPSGSSDL